VQREIITLLTGEVVTWTRGGAPRRDQQFRRIPETLRPDALRVVASPLKLSATPLRYDSAPSLLGTDTDGARAEFGIDVDEGAALRTQGVF
jgi:crotonobetainyl-CoA:carnitine CoA-transferase CaiB-like acyl-CoA transferase